MDNWKAIEKMLITVQNIVEGVVSELDEVAIANRNLATMMSTHRRLGKDSKLNHIEPGLSQQLMLNNGSRTYHGGVENVKPSDLTGFIKEAFVVCKALVI